MEMRSEAHYVQVRNVSLQNFCDVNHSSLSSSSSSHIAAMASRVSGASVLQNGEVAWASTFPRKVPTHGSRYVSKRISMASFSSSPALSSIPGGRQQQSTNMIGWRIAQRHTALREECPHFRFGRPFLPGRTVRRNAALFPPRTMRCSPLRSAAYHSFSADVPVTHPVPAASSAPAYPRE